MKRHLAAAALLAAPMFSADAAKRVPVLVELFTSEGCSSCPPADALLVRLDAQQPVKEAEVIVLSEHVDYWDRLGWKDPFSSSAFTARQQLYGAKFAKRGVYTPQMVVNGRVEVIGSDEKAVRKEIQRASGGGVTSNVSIAIQKFDAASNEVVVAFSASNTAKSDGAVLWIAVTESGFSIPVKNGENSGRTLNHSGVVRAMGSAGDLKGETFTGEIGVPLDAAWKRENLRLVAFVQERSGKAVLGAASIPLTVSPKVANGF